MKRRKIFALALSSLAFAMSAHAQTRAGEVRAVLPTGNIIRAGAPMREAQKLDAVYWNDILRTNRGGRMRVGLLDGSILNIGSESQLQVLEHDAAAQRTKLQLAYGRMRANVVRLARADSSFEVRTPVAVAGVVGTRFAVFALPDMKSIIVALEEMVRVRNIDASVPGEVLLRPGQFTRVERGQMPTPAEAAPPEMLRDAEEGLDTLPPEPEISRVEVSWPPAGCGMGTTVLVRAFKKSVSAQGKETEAPIDDESVSGRLTIGTESLAVEGGRATLRGAPSINVPQGSFTPAGKSAPVQTKIWEPVALGDAAGNEWRAPRAVFAGNAFAIRGPVGNHRVQFMVSGQSAALIWQGPCGAGFIAPILPGREYPVAVQLDGEATAQGMMNIISVGYRVPVPPSVTRGQQTRFGVDIMGLEGLDAFTQGRPVIVATMINATPAVIGNMRSSTPGASASGETITFRVGGQSSGAGGIARLDAMATGRVQGMFNVDVNFILDAALAQPRFQLRPMGP